MPTTIQVYTVTADKNQHESDCNAVKLAAIAETEQSTQKGTKELDNTVTRIQNEYDSILIDWDKTKDETDLETQKEIKDMNQ